MITKLAYLLLGTTLNLANSYPNKRATGRALVCLGDSYSSAVGAGTREPDNHCRRFTDSYFNKLRADPELDFDDDPARSASLACAGATANDVLNTQLVKAQGSVERTEIIANADAIVMTIGGNDIGFAYILMNCIYGWAYLGSCDSTMEAAEKRINSKEFGDNLVKTFKAVIDVQDNGQPKKDGQQLFVLGYPAFFNHDVETCDPPNLFASVGIVSKASDYDLTKPRRLRINTAIEKLNTRLADSAAAASTAVKFVNPNSGKPGSTDYYAQHRICDPNKLSRFFFEKADSPNPTARRSIFIRQDPAPATDNPDIKIIADRVSRLPKDSSDDFFYREVGAAGSGGGGDAGTGRKPEGIQTDDMISDNMVKVFHPTSAGQQAMANALKSEMSTIGVIERLHAGDCSLLNPPPAWCT